MTRAAGAFGWALQDKDALAAQRDEVQRLKARLADARRKIAALKTVVQERSTGPGQIQALQSQLIEQLAEEAGRPHDPRVTVVVTSCSRHDLLVRTLQSFFRHNTHQQTQVLVMEDGEHELDEEAKRLFSGRPIRWMKTGNRIGQIRAIDFAYSKVETPYIFHLEDDWLFERPGFIEKSMEILRCEPLCLQVWIRGFHAPDSHPILEEPLSSSGVAWRKVALGWRDIWNGFSFNPGLRRLRDYRLVGSYASVVEAAADRAGNNEARLSDLYRRIGFFAAILWDEDKRGYVRHKGRGRQVRRAEGVAG
jgi:hypothetical protein